MSHTTRMWKGATVPMSRLQEKVPSKVEPDNSYENFTFNA